MKTAYFDRFSISLKKNDALNASHPGPCDHDVYELLKKNYVKKQLDAIAPAEIAAELNEYGAWDDAQIGDTAANRVRIIWIAAGNIRDEL